MVSIDEIISWWCHDRILKKKLDNYYNTKIYNIVSGMERWITLTRIYIKYHSGLLQVQQCSGLTLETPEGSSQNQGWTKILRFRGCREDVVRMRDVEQNTGRDRPVVETLRSFTNECFRWTWCLYHALDAEGMVTYASVVFRSNTTHVQSRIIRPISTSALS